MRTAILLLALFLGGCDESTTEPNPCAPDENGYGCDPLPPPLTDTLIPLPDSTGH